MVKFAVYIFPIILFCWLSAHGYIISGTVVDDNGTPLTDACVAISINQLAIAYSTTNAAGYYEFGDLTTPAMYTLTPSKPLYSFLPAESYAILVSTDIAGKNFVGIQIGRDEGGSIDVDGTVRTYRIHVPEYFSAEKKLPLVILLHGYTGQGVNMEQLTLGGFNALSDSERFIAVYPDGILRRWNDGRNTDWTSDDTGFISRLIDSLKSSHNIDDKRVFCCGMSNGAKMTIRLAFELPDKIAAFAPVAGANLAMPFYTYPADHKPVPLLIINGTADPSSPYTGGPITFGNEVISTTGTIKYWVEHNGCNLEPAVEWFDDLYPSDGTRAWKETYSSPAGADVVLCGILDGGHTWPAGFQYTSESIAGKTCRDISANNVIWEFFRDHCNYKIAGYVHDSVSRGIPSATVTLYGPDGNTIVAYVTGENGYYEFNRLARSTYTVTCGKDGQTFSAATVTYAPLDGDIENANFYNSNGLADNKLSVYTWPNPCRLDENSSIMFKGLPGRCKLSIYTIAGELVNSIEVTSPTGYYRWQALTDDGQAPASGIYIYHVKSLDDQTLSATGKIALIR